MTKEEIAELFIRAAETDRRLPNTARPAQLKAQALPYAHDAADQAGWGGERYAEERDSFWKARSTSLKTSDVSDWEQCNVLILAAADEGERRCLWHWAIGKAGGQPFARWCKAEGIHVETGRRRKDRAIYHIASSFIRNSLQNNENSLSNLLPVGPEISDKCVNIADAAQHSWRDDTAFSSVEVPELRDFSWAAKRNEQRRAREARKRQAA